MHLSRLTLARRPDVAALDQLLNPDHQGRRADAHHRLIWSAFAGERQARRDFLWREAGSGRFIVLSARPPGESTLFDHVETTPFAPALAAGDRLSILLRANATRTVTEADGRKRHRDVVMEALHPVPRGARAEARMELAQEAGERWLKGQGARAGFMLMPREVAVTGYRVIEARRHGPRFGIIDIEGAIEVSDPALFLDRLGRGFGRAKAFGCGLMLIRRAR